MRLLYISAEYPPETGYGGIGTYTRHIAEGMARRGHEVTVIARSDTGGASATLRNGVWLHRIRPLPHPLPALRIAYPLRAACRALFPHTLTRLSWCLAAARTIDNLSHDRGRFDIIESAECGAEGLLVNRASRRAFVVRLHTPWEMIRTLDGINEPAGDRILLPFIERRMTRRAEAITAPSRSIAELLRHRWHLRDVSVIANPLPVCSGAATMPEQDKTTWIFTGRIERRKGIHHLIAAYAAVKKARPVPDLVLVGNAYGSNAEGVPYGEMIRKMIDDNRLSASVSLTGRATPDEVTKLLNRASVAFFPSLWENFPYTCIEAMACGCAVVTSDCGGLGEIVVNGECGLKVVPDSTEAIMSAMHRLLDDPGFAGSLGEQARIRSAAIADAQRICGEMERIYSHAAGY